MIYIYLESMETTYADRKNGGAFAVNYIPELTKLAQENEDFSGESEALNGGYTMPSNMDCGGDVRTFFGAAAQHSCRR